MGLMRFKFLVGDLDYFSYGGKWISDSISSFTGERYFLGIELFNWEDVRGSPGPENTKYNLSLVLIPHPLEVSSERLEGALSGRDEDNFSIEELVESLWGNGVAIPIEQINTSNFHNAFKALRQQAQEVDHAEVMRRPTNKIGSTGREYLKGDFISAIVRGLYGGRKDAWVLAKIYGANEAELRKEGVMNPFKKQGGHSTWK